ncbi:MAG: putative bifunctional diguanylate cyclase/phosphodiesterase [Pseudohaliea sp.]
MRLTERPDLGPDATASDGDDLATFLYRERLELYYRSLRASLIAVVVNSSILCWLLWDPARPATLLGWLLATLLVTVYRGVLAYRFSRTAPAARSARAWYRHAILGALLSGLTWGAAGFLLFSPDNIYNQSLLAFVLAGMCAGGVVSLAAFIEASVPFLVLAIVPYTLRLFLEGNLEAMQLGLMALLYLVLMSVFARRVNETVVGGFRMSHLRERAEAAAERQALYDDLTGLPNRRLLLDRLRQARARALRHGTGAAVLFLDLDHFKRINDSLGHSAGDEVLVEVSRRLKAELRAEDTACRLGGDEFVILLTELDGTVERGVQTTHHIAERIRGAVTRPVTVQGMQLHLSTSMGASLLPSDSDDIEDLLRHADTAMYRAKDEGRNTIRFFVRDMQEAIEARMSLEQALREALDQGELELYLQPQCDARGGIFGAEALLRWYRDGRWVPPAEFIPVAEESGLIYRLGDWVVDEACRLLAEFRTLPGCETLILAVNVSARQFTRAGFADTVLAALERHGVPAARLELEVTESLLIDELRTTLECMERLQGQGLRFTIDDFGTGYSSLRYLQTLAVDSLKIDQSFVRGVIDSHGDASIVRATLSMAQALKLTVLAEGVESAEIREFLVLHGCQRFQGYFFGRPVPVPAFRERLLSGELSLPP